ncbi:unnamed protein product, partial [Phaeothamnion confervicola]
MCKHILNARVKIRSPCCNEFYECSECHDEAERHVQAPPADITTFSCNCCSGIFFVTLSTFDERDKRCPHCKILFVLPAETPEGRL